MTTGLYIAIDFKPNLGGIAEHTHQMAKHLTESGERITVITPQLPGAEEFDKTCNYPVIRYGSFSKEYSKRNLRWNGILLLKIILSLILTLKPSYIICDRWDAVTGIVLIFASVLTRVPYFIFAHGSEFSQPVRWKIIRKLTMRRATQVICVSDYIYSLVSADKAIRSKLLTIYSGFDYREIEQFRKRKNSNPSPINFAFPTDVSIILTVSRLMIPKGIDKVIEAMPSIVSEVPDIRYVIVGEGIDSEILKNMASASPVRENILFLGPLTGDAKFECYDRCDIFVMPSRYHEGSPVVFPEASAFGKPVVGGTFGGQTEAIINGHTGLLVNPNDVGEISRAIIWLLRNPDEAYKLGNNGETRVVNELNWKMSSEKVLSVIYRYTTR